MYTTIKFPSMGIGNMTEEELRDLKRLVDKILKQEVDNPYTPPISFQTSCMWDSMNVPIGQSMALSCPCPKCTSYGVILS